MKRYPVASTFADKRRALRRFAVVLSVFAIALIGFVVAPQFPAVAAQDATPAAPPANAGD